LKDRENSADGSHCAIMCFSILHWEYHGIQALMLDFWSCPYSVKLSYKPNVEASSVKVKEASIS